MTAPDDAAPPPDGDAAGNTAQELGRRLHTLRLARGLTQRELAAPRYTAAYVSSVEAGRRMPSSDAIAHFAERLSTSRQELTTGRGPGHGVRTDLELALADARAAEDPRSARAAYRRLAEETKAAGDPLRRAQCHLGLGQLALDRGDVAEAGREFDEAARLSVGAPAHVRARSAVGRAECVRRQGDPGYAAYLLTRTVNEVNRAGLPDPEALLDLHAHLALCHRDLGDEATAANAATAALALAGLGDAGAVADLHLVVGRTLLADGDVRAAEVSLLQARQARRQVALTRALVECRLIRGRMRRSSGDLTGALRDLADAHTGRTATGHDEAATDSAVELAALYHALGHPSQARELLAGLPAAGPGGNRLPGVDRVLALLAADEGDLRVAERHLRAAVDGYRRSGPRRELAAVVLQLADMLQAQGRADEALRSLHDGLVDVERLAEEAAPTGRAGAAAPG